MAAFRGGYGWIEELPHGQLQADWGLYDYISNDFVTIVEHDKLYFQTIMPSDRSKVKVT